jgi:hypothetical protein
MLNMTVNGKWGMQVETEFSIMLMETCMMEFGTITNAMDMESTQIKKEQDMKVTGRMILNQDKELKFGQKEASILANMKMERSKDMVLTHGLMVQYTKEIGLITESMVWANTSGKTEENTMVTGIITICTEWESIFIPTELHMRANIKKIKKLDLASTSGPMEESMKDGGIVVNNMVWEFIKTQAKEK